MASYVSKYLEASVTSSRRKRGRKALQEKGGKENDKEETAMKDMMRARKKRSFSHTMAGEKINTVENLHFFQEDCEKDYVGTKTREHHGERKEILWKKVFFIPVYSYVFKNYAH